MALAIATNNAAMRAAASASSVNRDMEISMARLSSGKRINSASDDAAGVAISSRLSSEIRCTDQAIRNALDGQALIDTAEGAHKEIENILQRMREVSVQAANDTNNQQDRANLQAEMDAMSTEIDRIAATTTWAGANLMKEATSSFSFQVGSATEDQNQINVNIGSMETSDLFPPRFDPDVTTPVQLGSEFVLNSSEIGSHQTPPSVSGLANSGFVSTWYGENNRGDTNNAGRLTLDVFARTFDSTGTPTGTETVVSTNVSHADDDPLEVAALSDGGFVTVWRGYNGTTFDIYGRTYDASGIASNSEFLISAANDVAEDQSHPAVTALADGGFAVTWDEYNGSDYDVLGRLYGPDGTVTAPEFKITNDIVTTGQPQLKSSITSLSDGGFVVSWQANNGTDLDIYARKYDAQGNALSAEFLITEVETTTDKTDPSITALSDGGFAVTWQANNGTDLDIYGRLYNANGTASNSEFLVNAGNTALHQGVPSVTGLADGGVIVTWQSETGGGLSNPWQKV